MTRGQVLGSKFICKFFRRLKTANWRLQNWNVEFSCLKNFDITLQKENTVSKVSHSKNWIRSRAEFHETQNVESVKITPISIPWEVILIQGHGRHPGEFIETWHFLNGPFSRLKTSFGNFSLGNSKIPSSVVEMGKCFDVQLPKRKFVVGFSNKIAL